MSNVFQAEPFLSDELYLDPRSAHAIVGTFFWLTALVSSVKKNHDTTAPITSRKFQLSDSTIPDLTIHLFRATAFPRERKHHVR
jgi:hypothetical protein